MKVKNKGMVSLVLLIFISFVGTACSNSAKDKVSIKTTEKTETTSSQAESSTSSKESDSNKKGTEETGTFLSLNNIKFNLNTSFGDTELKSLDSKNLAILRNSIYAKYGYIFSTKEFSEYFSTVSWYKPTSKNVEEKLNDIDKENIKKITSLENKAGIIIKNSKDNKDYSRVGKIDIVPPDKSKKETLYITREDLKTEEGINSPTTITLKIKNSQVVFKSSWNDGVCVSIADFDTADKDIDIYITQLGTDIGCMTFIYKYDGAKIYKYDELRHFGGTFLYDEKGNIYYWFNDGSKKEYNKCYNYRTKQSSDIADENLKTKLNKFE